jgi:hypothetical protein
MTSSPKNVPEFVVILNQFCNAKRKLHKSSKSNYCVHRLIFFWGFAQKSFERKTAIAIIKQLDTVVSVK